MTSKIVTVVGATGTQGSSVVKALLATKEYHVRGITRSPEGDAAKELASQGVEIVQANLDDLASLESAFAGSHAIFAVTNFFEPFAKFLSAEKAEAVERQQGINLASAAASTSTLQHYIWSTLPNGQQVSGGKYVVPHFTGKNAADDYIKSHPDLLRKTTFLWVTFYAANLATVAMAPLALKGFGSYVQLSATPASTRINSIGDAGTNVGLFARAILSAPDKTLGPQGKWVLADVEILTAGEMLQQWAKAKGKRATFIQVSREDYDGMLGVCGEEVRLMMEYIAEMGDRTWSGEEGILTRRELGLEIGKDGGLVDTQTAFNEMHRE